MKLYIAGINHNDPKCRVHLIEWMKKIKLENTTEPDYIATEWDKEIVARIIPQRDEFSRMISSEWSFLDEEQVEVIVNSLAFEADSHLSIFPKAHILWIDHYTPEEVNKRQSAIDNYAIDRFNFLRGLNTSEIHKYNFIDRLSKYTQEMAINASDPSERDSKFLKVILEYTERNNCSNYGIVVVGSNHASDCDGKMKRLLEQEAFNCTVKILST